jgi:MFS family permease
MNKGDNRINNDGKSKVIIVSLVTALCLLGDSMLYVALPIYWQQTGLMSLWEVGLILSINRFVRLPLNPVFGWLYTKIPLRTGLIAAVLLAVLTTAGYGFANGLWLWLLLRCVWGIAWSLLRLGGLMTVVYYSGDHNRGYFMGTYNGLYRLGSLFGMLLGGWGTALFGFKAVAVGMGALSLLGVPLILLFVQSKASETNFPAKSNMDRKQIWNSPLLWKVMGSGFCISLLFQGVLTSTLSFIIQYRFTEEVRIWGFFVAAATISGVLQAIRWAWEPFLAVRFGRWSDGKRGRMPWYLSFVLIASAGFVCLPIPMSVYLWIFVLMVVLVAATALTTLMDTIATDASKGSSSSITVMTVYSVALDFGAAAGPMLAFLLLTAEYGLYYTYWTGALLFLIIGVIWYEKNMFLKTRS